MSNRAFLPRKSRNIFVVAVALAVGGQPGISVAAEIDHTSCREQGPFIHKPVPGGIVIHRLGDIDDTELSESASVAPVVNLYTGTKQQRPAAVFPVGNSWCTAIGVPLTNKSGTQYYAITLADGLIESRPFKVQKLEYPTQRLTIKNRRKVNPNAEDLARIKKENKRLRVVKRTRAERLISTNFQWPLAGPMSSPFGLKRFFNDQPRRPHGGIDLAQPEGTPIVAAADGLVVDTGGYFFNGNSVFIEHGLGLQSFYAHMQDISVEQGQRVAAGDVIGTVGATGRVTGAHLHWSIALNGTWVDPRLMRSLPEFEPPAAIDTARRAARLRSARFIYAAFAPICKRIVALF